MSFKHFNISENSSLDDVKAQYRKLSRQHHPDMGGSAEAFHEVHREYRMALEFLKQKAFQKKDHNLFKLINEQIYSIDGYIDKLNVPDPFKPAISYLVEKGINGLGKAITSKLDRGKT
jgi:DnaJ-class molecular chaperone